MYSVKPGLGCGPTGLSPLMQSIWAWVEVTSQVGTFQLCYFARVWVILWGNRYADILPVGLGKFGAHGMVMALYLGRSGGHTVTCCLGTWLLWNAGLPWNALFGALYVLGGPTGEAGWVLALGN